MNFKPKTKKGFTLIELLLVVAIIGVFATFAMVNLIGIREHARDAQRKSDLAQIRVALELYRSDQGTYPNSSLFSCGDKFTSPAPDTSVVYLQEVPCDPLDKSTAYIFTPKESVAVPGLFTSYSLTACLESKNDSQQDATPVAPCSASYTVNNP